MTEIHEDDASFPCYYEVYSSGPRNDCVVIVEIPVTHHLLCGGVTVHGETLILESCPVNNGRGWRCEHRPVARGAVTVNVVTVCDQNSILESVVISNGTGSQLCRRVALLPEGFVLIGGGASGNGQPIDASSPDGATSWCAAATDYFGSFYAYSVSSEADNADKTIAASWPGVTSYAIGIRRRDELSQNQDSKRAFSATVREGRFWHCNLGEPFGEWYHCFGTGLLKQSPVAMERFLTPAVIESSYLQSSSRFVHPAAWRTTRIEPNADQLHQMKKEYCYTSKRKK